MLVDVGERRVEHVHDLLVERADDLTEVALGLADVLDLGLEELVALTELGELLHGQRVDRADRRQLGLQLPDTGGRVHAFGQVRRRGARRVPGPAAQLASQGLDDRLATDGGLDEVQLRLLQPASGSGQLVLTHRPLAA